jgi:hypothetical protein
VVIVVALLLVVFAPWVVADDAVVMVAVAAGSAVVGMDYVAADAACSRKVVVASAVYQCSRDNSWAPDLQKLRKGNTVLTSAILHLGFLPSIEVLKGSLAYAAR